MNVKSVENLEKNVVKLEIEVDCETFEEGMKKSYIKNVKHITIPGFRKGKAPRNVVEKYYGEGVFYEDAINFVFPEAYDKAIEEKDLHPVDHPEIDIVEIGKGKPFVFTAKVTVKPEVVLGDYKGIEVEKVEYTVTDEDVEKEITALQNRHARTITVEDRAVENGDIAVIDFEGFVDDVPFEGGKGENYSLEIGSGSFIPGFEEQLVGKNINDDVDVNVTFPEEYHAEELKGKDALFKVKIHAIKCKELPELNDEFAKDTSEFDTLDALKADMKEKLTKHAEERAKNEIENKVLEKVVSAATIEIPQCMIENQIDKMVQDFGYRMQSQGITLEKYMEYTGMDMAAFREQFKENAERQVKTSLVLEKIATDEKVEVTPEDIEKEYEKMAGQYNMEVDKIKELMAGNELALKDELKMVNTVNMLIENAKLK